MSCGIYILRFPGTDKIYVGQSSNIEVRLKQHIQRMRKGTNSIKLNGAYRTYGVPELEIITECKEAELNTFENEIIEIFNSVSEGFNSLDKADSMPKLSGVSHGRSVHTKEAIIEVVKYLASPENLTQKYIANKTKIPASTIASIARGITHRWVQEEFPLEWATIISRPAFRNSSKDRGNSYPTIYSPEGGAYTIDNATKFAIEHSLSQGSLCSVLRGEKESHKGWKISKGEIS